MTLDLSRIVDEHLDHQESCGWHLDWPEALVAIRTIARAHERSAFPINQGEHLGKYKCRTCSTSVDHTSLHVLFPCPTLTQLAKDLGVYPGGED